MIMGIMSEGDSLKFLGIASQSMLGERPNLSFKIPQIPESAHVRYRQGTPMKSSLNPSTISIIFTLYHDPGFGPVGIRLYEVVILEYSASSTKLVTLTLQERIDPKANHINSLWPEHKLEAGQLADRLTSFRHTNIVNFLEASEDVDFVHVIDDWMDATIAETQSTPVGRIFDEQLAAACRKVGNCQPGNSLYIAHIKTKVLQGINTYTRS